MKPLRLLLALIFLNSIFIITNAQWVSNGPYGGDINCLAASGPNIFAGTYFNGIFISTDNGATWAQPNTSIAGFNNYQIIAIGINGSSIFASTDTAGIFLSTDNGNSWEAVNGGLPNDTTAHGYPVVNAFAFSGNNIFAGTDSSGVFLSTNNGGSWTRVNNGLTDTSIYSFAINGSKIFVGTASGAVFLSTNNAGNWTSVNRAFTFISNDPVTSLAIVDTTLLAGFGNGGIYASTDNGNSWTSSANGLLAKAVLSMVVKDSAVFASAGALVENDSSYGVYVSTNQGASWTQVSNGLTNNWVTTLTLSGNNIFAGTFGGGVFLSNNNGTSWTASNTGIRAVYTSSFAAGGNSIYSGAYYGGVFVTNDQGNSWMPAGIQAQDVRTVAVSGSSLVAGTDLSIFLSKDGGNTWTLEDSSFGFPCHNCVPAVSQLVVSGSTIYAATLGRGVYSSSDGGHNWTGTGVRGLSAGSFFTLAIKGTDFFAGTSPDYLYNDSFGIYFSSNSGARWTLVDNGLSVDSNIPTVIYCITTNNAGVFAGTQSAGVFFSSDNGNSWAQVNTGLISYNVYALATIGNYLFAGTDSGVYISSDNGSNWMPINTGLPPNTQVSALAVIGSKIYLGAAYGSIYQRPLSDVIPCSALFSLYPDSTTPHHYFALNEATGTGPLSYVWTWGDNSAADTGATPSHTYADSGYYTICLTITDSTGCTSTYCDSNTYLRSAQALMITVDVVTSLPTGIPQIENTTSVSIYPNPASTLLNIKTTNFNPQSLTIYDMDGRKVTGGRFTPQVDISALQSGLYFVEIANESVVERRRFVKL